MRFFYILSAVVGLSGCGGGLFSSANPPTTLGLLNGSITAGAPRGYCFDESTSKPSQGFAIIAPCKTLGANTTNPGIIGLATIQIGDANSSSVAGAESTLQEFVKSDAGITFLSSNGTSDTIDIISTSTADNQVIVHFSDKASPLMKGVDDMEWRAFLDINGRFTTIAVRGLSTAPLDNATGAALLDLIIENLQNPVSRNIEAPPAFNPWAL